MAKTRVQTGLDAIISDVITILADYNCTSLGELFAHYPCTEATKTMVIDLFMKGKIPGYVLLVAKDSTSTINKK